MAATLSFTARDGSPGSLTIEVAAVALLAQQNAPPSLRPQLNAPVLAGDDKPLGLNWGVGWAVPMSQRLIALGGNSRLQLLGFECPSLDTTDMGWGASGTIDATTDPVTLQAAPFGASVYGRAFAVGDYIIWNNPAVVNGRYQYEIDEITALNQNTFTLARRGQGAAAGTAQFATVMAAQSGQFFQLLDPTLFAMWDGTHQVFKFLWDGMIVSAVSATTAGLLQPVIVNLIPIPPAAAAMGLSLGPATSAATIQNQIATGLPPPAPVTTGGLPQAPGLNTLFGVVPVSALPGPSDPLTSSGNAILFNGIQYVYSGRQGSTVLQWVALAGQGTQFWDTRANRIANYDPAKLPLGTTYYETDTTLYYTVQVVGGVNAWLFYSGYWARTQAQVPTVGATLGLNDNDLRIHTTDTAHDYIWTGTVWHFDGEGSGTYTLSGTGGLPFGGTSAMWGIADGSTYAVSQDDGTTANVVSNTAPNTYLRL
jgi:hypothetical protein